MVNPAYYVLMNDEELQDAYDAHFEAVKNKFPNSEWSERELETIERELHSRRSIASTLTRQRALLP